MWNLCEAVAKSMEINGATSEEIAKAVDSLVNDANWFYYLNSKKG